MEDMSESDASSDIRPFEERCEAHATAAACCLLLLLLLLL
jgi:hypothetical protein